ncbi:MAG TPA: urate hydroxylase PuuD [Planctomycetota bacterium]|nr:urate hydroxylase PuuD [Planctomycetota bacterium]
MQHTPLVFASLATQVQNGLDYDQLVYRWVHLIAGVVWLSMLYSFTLIHANAVAALEADVRRKVVPEYVPRTMFWFAWGSLLTWLTGIALLMKLYYSSKSSPIIYAATSEHAGEHMPWSLIGQAFGGMFLLFIVYDAIARATAKFAEIGYLLWAAVAVGYGCYLDSYLHMSHRAIFIHIGGLLGTAMVANAWNTIVPCFRRIVAATREGKAPDPKDLDRAGVRSRHNLFMSTPLLFLMVAVHQEKLLGFERWQIPIAGVLVLGLVIGWSLRKAAPSVGRGS